MDHVSKFLFTWNCQKNFGPLKILVLDQNFCKNIGPGLIFLKNIGPTWTSILKNFDLSLKILGRLAFCVLSLTTVMQGRS